MRKWLVIAGIVVLVAVPVALKLARGSKPHEVELEAASERALAPSILASGTLAYESEVKLVPEVIGRVREILVQEGDFVKKGDLLMRLDPTSARADTARLEAALRQSRLNIERQRVNLATQEAKSKRYEALQAQGLVDANTFEEISSQRKLAAVELNSSLEMLQQTEAELAQSRERLAKTEFHAPISGKVTGVFIKVGETAVPSAMSIAGSDLMIVADTSSMYAEVSVDETDVARVKAGQSASLVPAAFPDQSWPGTVEQVAISPRQNPGQSKSYSVRIRLAQGQDKLFHPGMSCRAEIATRGSEALKALAVPVQAVRYEEKKDADDDETAKASVFVANGGKAQRRDVETGTSDDAYVEILRGIKLGEQVITGPARILRFLKEGDRIAASPRSP